MPTREERICKSCNTLVSFLPKVNRPSSDSNNSYALAIEISSYPKRRKNRGLVLPLIWKIAANASRGILCEKAGKMMERKVEAQLLAITTSGLQLQSNQRAGKIRKYSHTWASIALVPWNQWASVVTIRHQVKTTVFKVDGLHTTKDLVKWLCF